MTGLIGSIIGAIVVLAIVRAVPPVARHGRLAACRTSRLPRLGTTRSTRDPPLRPRQTRSPRIERQTDAPGAHRGPEGARDSARRSVEAQTESLRARHASVRIAYEAHTNGIGGRPAPCWRAASRIGCSSGCSPPLFAVAVVSLFAEATSRTPEEAADATGLGAALAVTVAEAVEQSGRGSIHLLVLGGS